MRHRTQLVRQRERQGPCVRVCFGAARQRQSVLEHGVARRFGAGQLCGRRARARHVAGRRIGRERRGGRCVPVGQHTVAHVAHAVPRRGHTSQHVQLGVVQHRLVEVILLAVRLVRRRVARRIRQRIARPLGRSAQHGHDPRLVREVCAALHHVRDDCIVVIVIVVVVVIFCVVPCERQRRRRTPHTRCCPHGLRRQDTRHVAAARRIGRRAPRRRHNALAVPRKRRRDALERRV